MSDTREREFALREAAVNDAEERYFKARPIDDGAMQRKAFRAGFDRAWDAKERELAEARADLQFVERWANHHGAKPSCTAEEALSVIQHYQPIVAITNGYEDGKVPDTPNPWERAEKAEAELAKYRMPQFAQTVNEVRLEEELQKAEAECERLRADAERYRWLRQYPIYLRMWAWTAKLLEKLDAAIDAERKP